MPVVVTLTGMPKKLVAVAVGPDVAAKLAVLESFVAAGITKTELARRLGKDEKEVRRILDPKHATKLPALTAALRALAEAGIDVPTTTAVIGYDDVTLAAHTSPALTTIRQDLAEGAALMVDRLMQRIAGHGTGSAIVTPVLIERQSA